MSELKVVLSGSVMECYQYDRQVTCFKSPDGKTKYYLPYKKSYGLSKTDSQYLSASRSRRNFIRRINANAGRYSLPDCFVSFTFKPERLCDLASANYEWKKFRQRLQRIVPDLRYLAVYEWGAKTGRFHYHAVFFGFPYIPQSKLQDLWGQGFVSIKVIRKGQVPNLGAYMAKYMAKDMVAGHYNPHKRRYFASTNLYRPRVFRFYFRLKVSDIVFRFRGLRLVNNFLFNSELIFIASFEYYQFIVPPGVLSHLSNFLDKLSDICYSY